MKRNKDIQAQAEEYAKDDYRHPVTTMQSFYDGAEWADSHLPKNLWISNEANPAAPDEDRYDVKKKTLCLSC